MFSINLLQVLPVAVSLTLCASAVRSLTRSNTSNDFVHLDRVPRGRRCHGGRRNHFGVRLRLSATDILTKCFIPLCVFWRTSATRTTSNTNCFLRHLARVQRGGRRHGGWRRQLPGDNTTHILAKGFIPLCVFWRASSSRTATRQRRHGNLKTFARVDTKIHGLTYTDSLLFPPIKPAIPEHRKRDMCVSVKNYKCARADNPHHGVRRRRRWW